MRNVVLLSVAFSFFIWILPLGVFIKPAQEKLACDGQRAVCMCSHGMSQPLVHKAGETIYQSPGGFTTKEHHNPGGGSNQFLLAQNIDLLSRQEGGFFLEGSFLFTSTVFPLIEHVPKA